MPPVLRTRKPPADTKDRQTKTTPTCSHSSIQVDVCPSNKESAYKRPSKDKLAKAQGVELKDYDVDPGTFPPPLVLQDDDLDLDPKHPGQSLFSWRRLGDRNAVTAERKTIYIAASPEFDSEIRFAESWSTPRRGTRTRKSDLQCPDVELVAEYIRAFYHPLPVVALPRSDFAFVPWSVSDMSKLKSNSCSPESALIGLRAGSEIIGIRSRADHNNNFSRQLNLNDLLDVAITSLPTDAYALLMLVDQDLYEDDDDEFVCGRAYGGSRVAVVSSARYNPALDKDIKLDLDHVWPLSHCRNFTTQFPKAVKKTSEHVLEERISHAVGDVTGEPQALHSAINAAVKFRQRTCSSQSSRWLSRILRTAAHELGHCFGMGHCVYYACAMQGSASITEDHRQPPYLCPVDLAKLLAATKATEIEHLSALKSFCDTRQRGDDAVDELVVALGAWVDARLLQLSPSKVDKPGKKHAHHAR